MRRYTEDMATKARPGAKKAVKRPSQDVIDLLWRQYKDLEKRIAESDKKNAEVLRRADNLVRALRAR